METQLIHSKIHDLRGQRVLLDFDLAELYGVPTKVLNQSVRRNLGRFPEDFMFQMTTEEWNNLRSQFVRLKTTDVNWSQFVTSSRKHRGEKYLPLAFTEQGVAMLSSVLHSEKAIQTNIAIMRAFVALRRYALSFAELAEKVLSHDKQLDDINEVLKWLGEENQARADEIAALQAGSVTSEDWENRERIGFKK